MLTSSIGVFSFLIAIIRHIDFAIAEDSLLTVVSRRLGKYQSGDEVNNLRSASCSRYDGFMTAAVTLTIHFCEVVPADQSRRSLAADLEKNITTVAGTGITVMGSTNKSFVTKSDWCCS
jgi:hypothetical protein